jgi:hypothetical protein
MLLIECGLVLVAVLVAFTFPPQASRSFAHIEHGLARLARRRTLTVIVVTLTALAMRAALLPILPIPYPGVHDEFSYVLMADTFAHGRLTNPTHPMWIHFEAVSIIHQPTYCSMYYPAQGLFLALGQVVAGHPFWGVCLSAGLMCAAITWMLQGWVPPLWALIGGLLATIRLGTFSYWANSYFGGSVAAIGGALALGALPRIKESPRARYAVLMGVGLAILANSRPYEGIFFSLPLIAALISLMRKKKNFLCYFYFVILPLGLILAATAAFMFYYFWRTTGSPLHPPYFINLRTYFVDPAFPWLPLRPVPDYHHEVMRNHYLGWSLSQFQYAQAHPIFSIVIKSLMLWFFFFGPLLSLPFLILAVALPSGTSFKDLGRNARFLLLVCGMTLLAVLLPSYANPHYAAPFTAAVYALLVMAMQRVRRWRIRGKRAGVTFVRTVMVTAMMLFVLRGAIPILHLRILNGAVPETWCSPWNQLTGRAEIEALLERSPGQRLVLVHYAPQHDTAEGWVSNSADIDHSRIVWAHDMGQARNKELVSYFKGREIWMLEPDANPRRLFPYTDGSTR